jgi:hypothetical protein
VAARLVDLYGEQCLPIFERLEEELQEMHRRAASAERARRLAKTGDLSSYRSDLSAAPSRSRRPKSRGA